MAHFYEINTQTTFVADRPCRGITDLEAIFAQEFSDPVPWPSELFMNVNLTDNCMLNF